ncbi:hypothetical protein KA531_01875 [Candidatus Saccharibacteria bacterium]|nr:hypothetical protein [Candidatus Saccharibacteria bacterium]
MSEHIAMEPDNPTSTESPPEAPPIASPNQASSDTPPDPQPSDLQKHTVDKNRRQAVAWMNRKKPPSKPTGYTYLE